MDALVNTAPTNKDRTDTNMTNRCNRVRSIFNFKGRDCDFLLKKF